MTATEKLRKLLDELGIKWSRSKDAAYSLDRITIWTIGDIRWFAHETEGDMIALNCTSVDELTPEQAIQATLGRETCMNISNVTDQYGKARFVCSKCGAWIDSRMLWNPEYPRGESPWVLDCKLNYCPNCRAKVVDE